MSDTWYRKPLELEPYKDAFGFLWTLDGICLNPIYGCDEPAWLVEMKWADLMADLAMAFPAVDVLGSE